MKIDSIKVYKTARPLRYPWRTAYGEDTAIQGVLVQLTGEGEEGWGEAAPLYAPTYSPETAESVFYVISEFIAPRLVGQEFETADQLLAALQFIKGNFFAKGAVESAWWTLQSRLEGVPLHQLLGGTRREVSAGADFGVQDSLDMLLEKIASAVDRGFSRVKLKIRRGWDLDIVRTVRETFPDLVFHVDCNSSYTLDDLALFKALDAFNLAMFEQPLGHADLLDHAALQQKIGTPVCLDESITSLRILEQALNIGACQVVNLKVGRVGGLSVAKQMHDLTADAGVPCWVGSMLESGIGMGILIELATLPNFSYAGDLFPTSEHFLEDISVPDVVLPPDCKFSPSDVPGIPYSIDPGKLAAATLAESHFPCQTSHK